MKLTRPPRRIRRSARVRPLEPEDVQLTLTDRYDRPKNLFDRFEAMVTKITNKFGPQLPSRSLREDLSHELQCELWRLSSAWNPSRGVESTLYYPSLNQYAQRFVQKHRRGGMTHVGDTGGDRRTQFCTVATYAAGVGHTSRSTDAPELALGTLTARDRPDADLIDAERIDRVGTAVDSLSGLHRLVIRLVYGLDRKREPRSYSQVSRKIGLSKAEVGTLVIEACAILRPLLAGELE